MGMNRPYRLASVLIALLLLLQMAQTAHVHVLRGAPGQQATIGADDDASACLLCWAMQGTTSAPSPATSGTPCDAAHVAAPASLAVPMAASLSPWAPRGPPLS